MYICYKSKKMDKVKNIVTNILGLVIWGYAVSSLSDGEYNVTSFVSLVVVGIVLFRFKFSETKGFLIRFFDVKIGKSERMTNTVDPDKDEKPKTKG